MANPEHLAILELGIDSWNTWRKANPLVKPDLIRAKLSHTDLRRANLSGAQLTLADLRSADLSGGNLSGSDLTLAIMIRANLSGVDLSLAHLVGARLSGVDLSGANLSQANLSGVDLSQANLSGAKLTSANFSHAFLNGTDLSGADLSEVNFNQASLIGAELARAKLYNTVFANTHLVQLKELEYCHHLGPSALDYSTLARSWPLREIFLKGCGLPDNFIDYMSSLLMQPIQYYSCFISYSSKDKDFAQRLHADLQNKGVRCWFAENDMKGGVEIYVQIVEAIRVYEKILLVLSEHSMNSEWVKTEIAKARRREVREKRKVLFPIRLVDFETIQQWECFDADVGTDLASKIREIFIPNFSNWKSHDAYQQAFDRLLQDLKPELESKPVG